MKFFKWRKNKTNPEQQSLPCSYCSSTDTVILSGSLSEYSHPVKVWRGERYITCRCRTCGKIFYVQVTSETTGISEGNRMIEDEDELHEAEKELKRKSDDEGDHRYPY